MKVLVFGSRDWTDKTIVEDVIWRLQNDGITGIVHGACRGADSLAGDIAYKMCMDVFEYPADWAKLGAKAGPMRNQAMLAENIDISFAVAFHDSLSTAKGSGDMLRRCHAKSVKVLLVSHEDPKGSWL